VQKRKAPAKDDDEVTICIFMSVSETSGISSAVEPTAPESMSSAASSVRGLWSETCSDLYMRMFVV